MENIIVNDRCVELDDFATFEDNERTIKNIDFINVIITNDIVSHIRLINIKFINCQLYDINIYGIFDKVYFYKCKINRAFILKRPTSKIIVFEECELLNYMFDPPKNGNYIFKKCQGAPGIYSSTKPFYGYKYTEDHLIILEIPTTAIYTQNHHSCRTNIAKVVSILNINGTYSGANISYSYWDSTFEYKLGSTVHTYCEYDDWDNLNAGIHFYKNIEDAYLYYIKTIKPITYDL